MICLANERSTRILYVEDDKNVQLPISKMLGMLGYEVKCADNGKLGIEKAESWKPDIILIDVDMPVMNGFEAIRTLRSKPGTSKIPIFVLSGYIDVKTRDWCKQVGVDRFLIKPLDIHRIDATIKEALR